MESGFLHETKTILRSLVISCPNGMTVDRLNRDYRETVGGWIPFKKLGYQSLELFLKSIPDTLVLTGHGREARVGFVANNKTQHINEMISRQKNTTRDRKTAVRPHLLRNNPPPPPPPSIFPSNFNQSHLLNQAQIYCTYNPNTFQINNMVQFYQPQRNASFHPQLQPQFQVNNARTVKYKNQSTAPVNVNEKTAAPLPKTNSNEFLSKTDESTKVPTPANISEKNNNYSRRMLSEPKKVLVEINNSKTSLDSKTISSNMSTDERRNANDANVENISKNLNKIVFPSQAVKVPVTEKTPEKVPVTEKKPDKVPLTEKKPEKVPVTEKKPEKVPVTENKPEKVPLTEKKPEKVPLTEMKSNKTINSDGRTPENSTKAATSEKINYPIKFSSRKKLTEKIIKFPNLPTVAESKALTTPPVEKHNSKADSDVSQNSATKNINTSKYLTDPFSQTTSSADDIDEAVPEFAADYRVFHVDFPENTVPFGWKFPSVKLPAEFKKGAVIGVFISEIHSPFKFWFHPHKENHELDVLMCSIESFYERLGAADMLIPRSCITPGQICVALYNDMWHRAEILSTVINNKIKVLFVDYGTVSEVEVQNVKYLQNRFAETPIQAIRGSLSHIKPVSIVWQKGAINEFLSLVAEVFLYAQIVEIDQKEKTVYMVLCDTNSGQTVQINKLLVDRGFASLDSEWDEDKIKKNGYRKRHPKDIFPTFEMLETGEYPSLCELEQLLAQGIDYEKITEKIILSNFRSNNVPYRVSSHVEKMSYYLLDTNPFKIDIISDIISLKMYDK